MSGTGKASINKISQLKSGTTLNLVPPTTVSSTPSSPSESRPSITSVDALLQQVLDRMTQMDHDRENDRKLLQEERDRNNLLLQNTIKERDELKLQVEILKNVTTSKNEISSSSKSDHVMSPSDKNKLRSLTVLKKALSPSFSNNNNNIMREILDDLEEEKVRKDEEKYVDRVIYNDEEEDEDHLQSYIKWLEKREKLYPYVSHKHSLYKSRYSLLSSWGRYSEWLRTGFMLNFPVSLYGNSIRRWYQYKLYEAGITTKKYRKVSDRILVMPAMSYDNKDVRVKASSVMMDDILPACHALRGLPEQLQYAPDKDMCEKEPVNSLQDYTQNMLKIKKLRMKLLGGRDDDDDPSSSGSDSDDLEEFDCALCGVAVRNRPYSKICINCEKKKAKKEFVPPSSIPPLECDDEYDHKARLDAAIKKTIVQDRQYYNTVKREQEITVFSSNALGRIFSELFTPATRTTLEMTKLPPLSPAETIKAVDKLAKDIGKFNGDVNKAPTFLHQLCSGIYRYSLSVQHSTYLLAQCVIGEAKSWFEMNVQNVSRLESNTTDEQTRRVETLLLLFKEQYMGLSQINMWKRELEGTKLTSTTVKELKSHYNTFVSTANNLRLCDNRLDDTMVNYMYFHSLPTAVRQYIGNDYKRMVTLDEIYRCANEHLSSIKMNEKTLSDGAMAPRQENINMNAYYTQDSDVQYNALHTKMEVDPQISWKQLNASKMTCFHCGKSGHAVLDCRLLSQPQTALGAVAWAKRNANIGRNTVYDKEYYIKRASGTASAVSPAPPTPSSSSPSTLAARTTRHPKAPRRPRGNNGTKPNDKVNKNSNKNSKDDATTVSSSSGSEADE